MCNMHYLRFRKLGNPEITKHDIKRKIQCEKGYCIIPLNNDKVSFINHQDHENAQKYNWTTDLSGYVYNQTKNKIYLHRMIMNPTGGLIVDHKNGDKLDNRRINLRNVNYSENGLNRFPYIKLTTEVTQK